MLCIIAFFVFAVLSIFSASYRQLAKEAFRCVYLKATFRPCDVGLDQKIRAKVLSRIYNTSPPAAQVVGKHFELFSWVFFILSVVSLFLVAEGAYNLIVYGTCDPVHPETCLFTDQFAAPICPASLDGVTVGPDAAKVTVIQFGCFTCEDTASAESDVQEVLEQFNGSVRYIFKSMPISAHNYSVEAAEAAFCASEQGKYWDYRKQVFANQESIVLLGVQALENMASGLGMNMTEFKACMQSNITKNQIVMMQMEGLQSHVKDTPVFFVNGRYVRRVQDLETIVKEELAKT